MTKLTISNIKTWRQALAWVWQNRKSVLLYMGLVITFLRWCFGAISTDDLVKLITMLNPFSGI